MKDETGNKVSEKQNSKHREVRQGPSGTSSFKDEEKSFQPNDKQAGKAKKGEEA